MRRLSLTAVVVPFLLADSTLCLPAIPKSIRDLAASIPQQIEARAPWSQSHYSTDPERRWTAENFEQATQDPDVETVEPRSPTSEDLPRRWVPGTFSTSIVSEDEPVQKAKRWSLTPAFENHLNPNNLDGENDPDVIKRDSVVSRSALLNMIRPVREAKRRRWVLDDRMTDGSKLRPDGGDE